MCPTNFHLILIIPGVPKKASPKIQKEKYFSQKLSVRACSLLPEAKVIDLGFLDLLRLSISPKYIPKRNQRLKASHAELEIVVELGNLVPRKNVVSHIFFWFWGIYRVQQQKCFWNYCKNYLLCLGYISFCDIPMIFYSKI